MNTSQNLEVIYISNSSCESENESPFQPIRNVRLSFPDKISIPRVSSSSSDHSASNESDKNDKSPLKDKNVDENNNIIFNEDSNSDCELQLSESSSNSLPIFTIPPPSPKKILSGGIIKKARSKKTIKPKNKIDEWDDELSIKGFQARCALETSFTHVNPKSIQAEEIKPEKKRGRRPSQKETPVETVNREPTPSTLCSTRMSSRSKSTQFSKSNFSSDFIYYTESTVLTNDESTNNPTPNPWPKKITRKAFSTSRPYLIEDFEFEVPPNANKEALSLIQDTNSFNQRRNSRRSVDAVIYDKSATIDDTASLNNLSTILSLQDDPMTSEKNEKLKIMSHHSRNLWLKSCPGDQKLFNLQSRVELKRLTTHQINAAIKRPEKSQKGLSFN